MAHNFLLEVGLEEMPAHVVTPTMKQFEEKVIAFLEDHALDYDSLQVFSTPRRFGVKIKNLAEEQADVEEEVKGPAKKIALDDNGQWTKAAEGFVKGQGVTTDDIVFKELKGVEYVHVTKFIKGKKTIDVMQGLTEVVKSLTFPVSMHWGNFDFKYIRPIHWLVALLDEEVVPLEILDVKSSKESRGHRFLGEVIQIQSAETYEKQLADQFVVTDPIKRKQMILDQGNELAKERHWQIDFDGELLEEVNNLVEYPTVFAGSFDEKYLSVPEEVLVTSMKEHQRYFEVRNEKGQLLPFFVSVRNGDKVHLENVVKGNEKVLTARLEDAAFFYEEDKKLSIDDCVEKLKHVTFHEKIGSIYEKMQRVSVIASLIGRKLELDERSQTHLVRATEIYKFDLVTNMVGEFPELQGIMGEKYALLQGEAKEVAQAIREHYMPISADGELPQSTIGKILAVADKLDSVMSFFAAGMAPSGSNDPYALRRQTYGVIRILEEENWTLPLAALQEEVIRLIQQENRAYGLDLSQGEEEVLSFMKGRMKQYLTSQHVRYDIIEAVLNTEESNVAAIFEAAHVLQDHASDDNFKAVIEALTRVMNLATKAHELYDQTGKIDPVLFENEAEQVLYRKVTNVSKDISQMTMEEKYQVLANLREAIEEYFDQTMVMTDDETIKRNRLSQLTAIADVALSLASLDQLIVK